MIPEYQRRALDEWYRMINRVYLDRNFYRDRFSIFAHLVEVLGGLSLLATAKQKSGITPERYVPKAIAWWMALCGKVGIRSVEEMLWHKFPGVCTYCQRTPHDHDLCRERKSTSSGPDWRALAQIAAGKVGSRPHSLAQWQAMFAEIYPISAVEDYPATIGRFTEELGELAEALRVSPIAPGYFLSEAADVFAWLMHLQNLIHSRRGFRGSERGQELTRWFVESYPDKCPDCDNPVCTCPPILPGTLGRIAHEIPLESAFMQGGALLSQEEAQELFELGSRTVRLGSKELTADVDLIRQIHATVSQLKIFAVEDHEVAKAHSGALVRALGAVEDLASAQRVTQESVDALAQAIAGLPSESRTTLMSFLTGLSSSVWAAALIEHVKLLTG